MDDDTAATGEPTERARAVADGPLEVIDTAKLPRVSPAALFAIGLALIAVGVLILGRMSAPTEPTP